MRAMVRRDRQKGNVVAEVGLALPVLLFMMLGLVDIGRGLACKAALGSAARAGSRYASVRSTTSTDPANISKIATYVRDRIEGMDPAAVTVSAAWSPNNTRGARVQVNVTYNFEPIIPFIPITSVALSSSSESIISN